MSAAQLRTYPEISLDELPRYSEWPGRLLAIEREPVRLKTQHEVLREFDRDKWGELLGQAQRDPGFDLRAAEAWEINPETAPTRVAKNHRIYDEYGAIDNFLRQLAAVEARPVSIRFRLHPSEAKGKYAAVLRESCKHDLHYSEGTTLLQDCAWAQWVVGCESMAMVIGLLAGKRVFTSIPAAGRNCQLPQSAIQPLNATAINHALE